MRPLKFMLVAGEPSGDLLGSELVGALRQALAAEPFAPRFFGAGGPRLAAAGVELAFDLTQHAVTGLVEVLRLLAEFRRLMRQLLDLACERQPDVVVLVDFQGFNRRFAHALRRRINAQRRRFNNWRPRIVQYVSPQVWASRPGRAYALADDVDLLLCLFPFEREWYAQRVPRLRVEAVGHPILDRHGGQEKLRSASPPEPAPGVTSLILLLPGSRAGELRRHLPVMLETVRLMDIRHRVRFRLVLPDASLRGLVEEQLWTGSAPVEVRIGGLSESLAEAAVAIASTGTVTLECAYFRVPTVALYRTSPVTFWIGKRLATVNSLAMPNLLAGTRVMPEFLQSAATPEKLAEAAGNLLTRPFLRDAVRAKLDEVVAQLGRPGASARAARAMMGLFPEFQAPALSASPGREPAA